MLQMCMDQNFFLYGMIAAGILGVWCLFWSSRFYHTAVKDMRRREEPKGRWTEEILELADRRGAGMRDTEAFIRNRLQEGKVLGQRVESPAEPESVSASSLCGIFLLLGIWGIYLLQYERYVLYQYTLTAGSIISPPSAGPVQPEFFPGKNRGFWKDGGITWTTRERPLLLWRRKRSGSRLPRRSIQKSVP